MTDERRADDFTALSRLDIRKLLVDYLIERALVRGKLAKVIMRQLLLFSLDHRLELILQVFLHAWDGFKDLTALLGVNRNPHRFWNYPIE